MRFVLGFEKGFEPDEEHIVEVERALDRRRVEYEEKHPDAETLNVHLLSGTVAEVWYGRSPGGVLVDSFSIPYHR